MASTNVLTDMDLFISNDRMILHPVAAPQECIVIDRVTHEVSVIPYTASMIPGDSERKLVYAVIGIINLIAGPYFIVATAVSRVGSIFHQPILRIDKTEVIPFSKTTLHLTEEQTSFNTQYLSMIKNVLSTEHFYFCASYDLTHTVQRLSNFPPDFQSQSMFDRADKRFVWNQHLLRDWNNRSELKKYCLPILHGFVSIKEVTINASTFNWILISRRNIKRAGCRLFMRGCDPDGNPANYVETEQIIEFASSPIGSGGRCSFVQLRGSIPLLWSQMPNLKYKPPPVPIMNVNQMDVCQKHLNELTSLYGRVVLINLINHTGAEGRMEKEFASVLQSLNLPGVRFESFDFHHECRKMRWDRLSILMERIARDQEDIGYFHSEGGGPTSPASSLPPPFFSGHQHPIIPPSILCQQEGIFRTNCIDSLDRTNVVQGLIARRSLETQLHRLGILPMGESIRDYLDFEFMYRNSMFSLFVVVIYSNNNVLIIIAVWADNADIVSIEYSGTGALKTDFTRTGKRTALGPLMDGVNSMARYYKNNFADGFRQDAIDLFLGNYRVDQNEGKGVACPLDKKKDWKYMALPLIFLGSIAMFFFSILLPHEHSTETFVYLIFWLLMIVSTFMVIMFYGTEFVDFPKLTDVRHGKNKKIE